MRKKNELQKAGGYIGDSPSCQNYAFLWFMGVLRDRMGIHENRFLVTVFLGSGLLFLAIVFTSSGVFGVLIMAYEAIPGKLMDSATYTFRRGFVSHDLEG